MPHPYVAARVHDGAACPPRQDGGDRFPVDSWTVVRVIKEEGRMYKPILVRSSCGPWYVDERKNREDERSEEKTRERT
jgi:hypothetical protein